MFILFPFTLSQEVASYSLLSLHTFGPIQHTYTSQPRVPYYLKPWQKVLIVELSSIHILPNYNGT